MASNKEMRKIAKDAKTSGFDIEKTRGGHYKIIADDGEQIVIPFSPGSSSSERDAKVRYRKFKERNQA